MSERSSGVEEGQGRERVRRLANAHAGVPATARVQRLGEGEDHAAYLVDDHLVVRLAKDLDPAEAAAEVARDQALLVAVAEVSPLPVPAPAFAVPREGCLAYERLPGVPLLDVLRRGGDRVREATTVGGALGRLLRALHDVPRERVEGLVEVDVFPPSEWLAAAKDHHAAVRDAIAARHRAAVASFLREPPSPDGADVVFSHNDLGIEHVLVDPGTSAVTGIIDWSDAALVDPAMDFARILRDLGWEGLGAALDAYGDAGEDRVRPPAVVFHARCALLEDLAFGLEHDRDPYVGKSRAALEWLF